MYHVTLTKYVSSIVQQGIRRYARPSNWVNKARERYGEGYIFAFESWWDAVRWAGKMDWEFNQNMGTGKISIIEFTPDCEIWETDESDPLTRASYIAAWVKCRTQVRANQIISAPVVTQQLIQEAVKKTWKVSQ
jgi:hypothetical protein